jgi:hypothetical protein
VDNLHAKRIGIEDLVSYAYIVDSLAHIPITLDLLQI